MVEEMLQISQISILLFVFWAMTLEMKSQESDITLQYPRQIDLILFIGQSNMAGRGKVTTLHPEDAPIVTEGAGYEFRAISDTTKLYPIDKKFGLNENLSNGINDGSAKTGGCVPSFVNAYFKSTHIPVVAVSSSEGGTNIGQWQPNKIRLKDAIDRIERAKRFLNTNDMKISHLFMVWCQGESDGDIGRDKESYKKLFYVMLDKMKSIGVEKCFIIVIGEYNGEKSNRVSGYQTIQAAQEEIAQENDDVVIVCSSLRTYKENGMMRDEYHFYQDGYNWMGDEAGMQSAIYRNNTYPSPISYETITIPHGGVTTYCSENNLDFTEADGIQSYYLQVVGDSLVRQSARIVPSNTGLFIEGKEGVHKIEICSDTIVDYDDVLKNDLIGTNEETDIDEYDYVLGVENSVVGFYRMDEPTFIDAHTAFLPQKKARTDCVFLPIINVNINAYDIYDMNNDGKVDISDIIAVINYIANGNVDKRTDVNQDEITDISDIVAIINYIASKK